MQKKTNEILDILQEECAELIQIISKCKRFGIDTIHLKANIPNRQRLVEEIGDVICMLELLEEHNFIDPEQVKEAKLAKREKLKVWSSIFKETQDEN